MSGTRQDGSRPALPLEERESHGDENKAFVERVCLPFLLSSQNTDGGWGFHSGSRSRVEASAWALLALRECAIPRTLAEPTARGFRFLEATQLPDGAWPASPESREGCWVTALACWALLGLEEFSGSVRRGMSWLCADQPGEARLLWRLLRRLHGIRRVSSQKDSYYGWSWTLGTASWVEPTSSAMIVLGSAPAGLLPAASRRMRLAEAMLYDRMCPGGGWNCGNPMVYGVAGEPQVVPTVWALLALRDSGTPEFKESLDWLEGNRGKVQSLASLALTKIGLDALGRSDPNLEKSLAQSFRDKDTLVVNLPAIAWTALAMSGKQKWLKLTMPGETS